MTIAALKKVFMEDLNLFYPKEESNAFFKILLKELAGLAPYQVLADPNRGLEEQVEHLFFEAMERLRHHEPIQYITGKAYFTGLVFKVTPQVLIPRPETEELVDWVGEELYSFREISGTLLDIGTGSGCIAIVLAKRFPGMKIVATDSSLQALEVAKKNGELHAVNVSWMAWDLFSTPPTGSFNPVDFIISNPPYIPDNEKAAVGKNVLLYEPSAALFVPANDPLKYYRAILDLAGTWLKDDGAVFFEIHPPMTSQCIFLAESKGFRQIATRHDLAGKVRFLRCARY